MSVLSELQERHKVLHAKFFPIPQKPLPLPLKLLPVVISGPELGFVFPDPTPVKKPEPEVPEVPPVPASHNGPSLELIMKVVCERHNIRRIDFVSHRRTNAICRARQIACYLAKKLTPMSLPQIGRGVGGRDHTTVLHAVRKIARLRADNPDLDQALCELEACLCCVPVYETAEGAHETEAA